ncbi:MAG: pilus assembly protein [Armatimonadetes bacterium]|nr:pilus assembly protein [Armatimonadota bacterium]
MVRALSDLAYAWRRALRRLRPGRRPSRRGATLIEFAVVLGVVLFLMTGIMEFSIIYKDLMVLNQATREGVRCAVVGATSATVDSRVRACAATLAADRLTTEVRYSTDDGASFAATPGTVDGRNDVPAGALIRVHAEYPHRVLVAAVLPGVTEVRLRCDMIMQRQ